MWPRPTTRTRSFSGMMGFSMGCWLVGKAGVSRCEKEDDGAVKDLANRFGDVEQGKNAVQHGQDQCPDDGPGIAASAAEDRGAADDHCRHRWQEINFCESELRGVGAADNDQAVDGRKQAAGDIVDQQYSPYADT